MVIPAAGAPPPATQRTGALSGKMPLGGTPAHPPHPPAPGSD
jgi:hypothetical protein